MYKSLCLRVSVTIVCLALSALWSVAPATGTDYLSENGWVPSIPGIVRGIYVTGYTAGRWERLRPLLDLIDATELNAMILDVKDCTGYTTYRSSLEEVREYGASGEHIESLAGLVRGLRNRGIYCIGRVVVFSDPVLSRARPDLAVREPGGHIWKDRAGIAWTDPYSPEVWRYNLDIAVEAAKAGFDEIQFDYIRFPSDGRVESAVYPSFDGRSKEKVIEDFLAYAVSRLRPVKVPVSADIFGLVPTAVDDLKIGQKYERIIAQVDVVSPMVYPSHYAPGSYGLEDPDSRPFETVAATVRDAQRRGPPGQAKLRPWLQDFSLRHVYARGEVVAQIEACESLGVRSWMFWNPANRYTSSAFRPWRRDWGTRPEVR